MDSPRERQPGRQPGTPAHVDALEIGARIRRERELRGLSLRELARRAGLSPSLVSQIETGKSQPSVSSLAAIGSWIGLSLNELVLGKEPEAGPSPDVAPPAADGGPEGHRIAQQEGTRHTIRLESGVTWERLTAEADHEVDFLYVTYEVGGASTPTGSLMRHQGKEYGFVIAGRLGIAVGVHEYELVPGGSISFDSTVPHRLWNAGTEPVRAVWAVIGRGAPAGARTVEFPPAPTPT